MNKLIYEKTVIPKFFKLLYREKFYSVSFDLKYTVKQKDGICERYKFWNYQESGNTFKKIMFYAIYTPAIEYVIKWLPHMPKPLQNGDSYCSNSFCKVLNGVCFLYSQFRIANRLAQHTKFLKTLKKHALTFEWFIAPTRGSYTRHMNYLS